MTAKDLGAYYGIAPYQFKTDFCKTSWRVFKRTGDLIYRTGRGDSTQYFIRKDQKEILEKGGVKETDSSLPYSALSLSPRAFTLLFTLGHYEVYNDTPKNLLKEWQEYYHFPVRTKKEEKMDALLETIKEVKQVRDITYDRVIGRIISKRHKHGGEPQWTVFRENYEITKEIDSKQWYNILKLWIYAYNQTRDGNYGTYADAMRYLGLGRHHFDKARRLLEEYDVINPERVTVKFNDTYIRLGTRLVFNGFIR